MNIDWLLIAGIVTGATALVSGELLKHRRIRAEHWLWKKRRLARARLLMFGGSAVTVMSAAAIVVI
jgi:hypothetical protein